MDQNKKPPGFAGFILRLLYPDNGEQSPVGDFREVYSSLCQNRGKFSAGLWYRQQVLLCILHFIKNKTYWSRIMFGKNFKIFIRNFKRNKFYSSINIAGLVIGIVSVILIFTWIDHELSYDNYHANGENIYRILTELEDENGETVTIIRTPAPLFSALKSEVPEVLNACRWSKDTRVPLKNGDIKFYEDGISSIDPDFLRMFSHPFKEGSMDDAFSDMRSVVITERLAKKYFGDEDPVGKLLNWNNWQMYTVRGVIKDVPKNSHINFDLLRTFQIEKLSWPDGFNWRSFNRNTYVQLDENADVETVNTKITKVLHDNNFNARRNNFRLKLQPLTEIHIRAGIGDDYAETIDILYIKIFMSIAIVILILACINYINLSTARSISRSKEIGIRKVAGAKRKEIIKQFLIESLFTAFFAYIISVILAIALIPEFNLITGKDININFLSLKFFAASALIIFTTGIAAGFYPALLMSSYNPLSILKSHRAPGSSGASLRKILVVFQFAVSIGLIICTIIVYQQLYFIRNMNVGFDKDNIIYVQVKDNIGEKFETARTELLKHPGINEVSIKYLLPSNTMDRAYIHWQGRQQGNIVIMNHNSVNYDYFKTLGIEMINGREFTRDHPVGNHIIINEEAQKLMKMDEPVGKNIWLNGNRNTIIGVVRNAHFKSLHIKIMPDLFQFSDDRTSNGMNLSGYILIKTDGEDFSGSVKAIEKIWYDINPDYPFEYRTLQDEYSKMYRSENKLAGLFNYFTVIAIVISCLGLYGLTAYTTEQRSKEIGIRKTLGAKTSRIITYLMKDLIKWIIIANLLVWPIVWKIMNNWLGEFAYHIIPGLNTFILTGIVSLLIGLITVSYNTMKAAVKDPVETLRYE
ncbi:MAG: FtsX-like permease family protein [bacterium]|nr:FtsX-like permease family protein [bacterium]